jgi:hypothetical protein
MNMIRKGKARWVGGLTLDVRFSSSRGASNCPPKNRHVGVVIGTISGTPSKLQHSPSSSLLHAPQEAPAKS